MKRTQRYLTEHKICEYLNYLQEQERSNQTVGKYRHDLLVLMRFLNNRLVQKGLLIEWKGYLTEKYASASVNSILASLNGFLVYMGWIELRVKPLKIQRAVFTVPEKELGKNEYKRLIEVARRNGNERLSLIIQTICATGIRVSELKYITVESVKYGHVEVFCKGKHRTILLPSKLCQMLRSYLQGHKKTSGAIFTTRSGRHLDRSNIWRDMKALCESAEVSPEKVFPHNLRHLFARTYYNLEKDISRLADILGHSSVTTTRIYTIESSVTHARQIERMGLIFT